MKLSKARGLVLVTLCCIASIANGKELVAKFTGSGDKSTGEFEVKAPWIVDWRVTSEFQGQMGLNVNLVDVKTGRHMGKVTSTKWISNGVRLFDEGGHFRFEVNSTFAEWTLIVEELTRAEAEMYTPKNQ